MRPHGLCALGPSVTAGGGGRTPYLVGLLEALAISQVAPGRVPAPRQGLSLALIRLAERAHSRNVYFQSQCELYLPCPQVGKVAPSSDFHRALGLWPPHPLTHPADNAYSQATAFLTVSSMAGGHAYARRGAGGNSSSSPTDAPLHPNKMTSLQPKS